MTDWEKDEINRFKSFPEKIRQKHSTEAGEHKKMGATELIGEIGVQDKEGEEKVGRQDAILRFFEKGDELIAEEGLPNTQEAISEFYKKLQSYADGDISNAELEVFSKDFLHFIRKQPPKPPTVH